MSGPGTGGLYCGLEIAKATVYPKWTARLMLGEVELSSSFASGSIYVSLVDSRYTPYSCHSTFKSKTGGMPLPPGTPSWAWGSISSSWVASTIQLTGSLVRGSCLSQTYGPPSLGRLALRIWITFWDMYPSVFVHWRNVIGNAVPYRCWNGL